jgi:hypothetical protein
VRREPIEEVNHDRQAVEAPGDGRRPGRFRNAAEWKPARASDIEPDRRRQPSEVPGDNYLYGADSSDASNVWAVGRSIPPRGGFARLVMRYDGTAWSAVQRTGLPGNETLRGVDAASASDVWVVGDHRVGISGSENLAAHWNGTAWTRESTPDGNPGSVNSLNGVAAAGGTVWAVGTYIDPNSSTNRRKLILQRTGGSWRVSARRPWRRTRI